MIFYRNTLILTSTNLCSRRLTAQKCARFHWANYVDANFDAVKKNVLIDLQLGIDSSNKGNVDEEIQEIIATLNSYNDYITTSSCSGRIAFFHKDVPEENLADEPFTERPNKLSNQRRKRGRGLGITWCRHTCPVPQPTGSSLKTESIEAGACKEDDLSQKKMSTHDILFSHIPRFGHSSPDHGEKQSTFFTQLIRKAWPSYITTGTLELKFDPMILHLTCKNLQAAHLLTSLAVQCGFRHTGLILSSRGHLQLTIRGTFGFCTPLQINKCIVISPFQGVSPANEKISLVAHSSFKCLLDHADAGMRLNLQRRSKFYRKIINELKNV